MLSVSVKNFDLENWFLKSIKKVLEIEKIKDGEVSIVVCGDFLMRRLNCQYRKKDKTTDVLSFAEYDIKNHLKGEGGYIGEIFISYPQAKRQAQNIKEELINLFVHGLLHLKGYLHDTDKQEKLMNDRAKKLILKANISFR